MIRRLTAIIVVSVAAVTGASTPSFAAAQVAVDCGAGADLQAAIDAAPAGTILDISGTCVGHFKVRRHLVLRGVSAGVLDAQGKAFPTLTVVKGTVRVSKLTVTGGLSAGIENSGTLVMQRSLVTRNGEANDYGILNMGTATLRQSTVSFNLGTGILNGTPYQQATLAVIDSTVNDNESESNGGGITNYGTAAVVRSTIAHNESADAEGGGLQNWGPLTILQSTITGNVGDAGAGGLDNHASAELTATILAGNVGSGPSDCGGDFGSIVSHGYNLIGTITEDDPCPTIQLASTDQAGTTPPIDPRLLPLANYGGPTQTMKPASNSPAVDAIPIGALATDGTALCPASGTTDQRGKPRPQGSACDIGSVER
jgi:hypothetical protein